MGSFFAQENQRGSTGTVLLVDLLPAGLHGDSDAHTAPARCHAGNLAPGVRVWVVTLHAVQECVAVVASCGVAAEMVTASKGRGKQKEEETTRSLPM